MIRRLSSLCLVALGFAVSSGAAYAQVFKCVDAKGKVVYLQSPCPKGAVSSTIAPKSASAPQDGSAAADKKEAAQPSAPLTAAEKELDYRKRQKEKEDADKKTGELAKQKQEDCARAKEQLATYETGGRISRMDSKGERYFLEDSEIASEKARARTLVAQNCK